MKPLLVMFAVLMMTTSLLCAAEPPSDAKVACNKLLSALESGDFPAFITNGDAAFQALEKERFDAVVAQLAPRLKAGHEVSYLGELKQEGFQVTLWKLTFKGGGDDALATLSLKNGKVGGFWIK